MLSSRAHGGLHAAYDQDDMKNRERPVHDTSAMAVPSPDREDGTFVTGLKGLGTAFNFRRDPFHSRHARSFANTFLVSGQSRKP